MTRYSSLFLFVAAMLSSIGCRMCASPYDYCGPVVDDCCCGSCYHAAPCCDGGGPSGPVYDEDVPMIEESPTMAMPMTSSKAGPTRARPRSF